MASSPQIGSTPGDGAGVVGSPRISGLAVWEGGDALTQGEVRERLGLESDDFAGRVFRGAAIKERHLSLHSATLDMSMQARLRRGQERMFEYAVDVVDQLRIDPAEIGAVVSAGMYSLAVPSLAHQLVDRYGMEPTVPAYNLTAVGCASAVPLLRLMTRLLDPESGKKGLVVAAERFTEMLTATAPGDPRTKAIGAAIVGDGCAAALVEFRAGAPGPEIVASTVHHIAGTLQYVRLDLTEDDYFFYLDRDLPTIAAERLAPIVEDFLGSSGVSREQIDHWIVHPGGRAILEKIEEALSLGHDDLHVSYDILARRGNMGTASCFYLLHETQRVCDPARGTYGLMLTIGPGVVVGLMLIRF